MCVFFGIDPPETCDVYEGQKAGAFENDKPVTNKSGRTDVEGCCWWGRGMFLEFMHILFCSICEV